MSKAKFRAMREQSGYSQQALANAIGVKVLTIKRWEHEKQTAQPSPDAWQVLEQTLAAQREAADYAVEVALQAEELPNSPRRAVLTYYRDQAMYDAYGRDEGYFGVANANARAAGEALELEGFEVEYRYPTEGAISTPGSRY